MTGSEHGDLHTPGDGIFGTHVTWDDIEHDMQKALFTNATFGTNRTIKSIGDGNGFLSKICLIEPDWQNTGDDEELPSKFIAKLCTAVTMMDFSKKLSESKGMDNFMNDDIVNAMEAQVRTFHNCEVHVYHLLDVYKNTAIPRAKIFFARKFSEESPLKGYLLMEFVEELSLVHIYNSLTPENLHQPLRAIASLEALSSFLTEEEKALFSRKPLTEIFGTFFTGDVVESMKVMLTGFGGARMEPLINKLLAVLGDLIDTEWMDSVPDQIGMEKVLCHGDLWSTNVLWRKDGDNYKMAALIDYQTSHLGNPAGDLGRLLNTNLTGADRLKYTDELLNTFYGYLKEEIGDRPMPYTLDQLKEAYKRYQPTAGYMVVPMLGSMMELVLNAMGEEDRRKALDVLEEKMEVMITDVLEMYERNKKLQAEQ